MIASPADRSARRPRVGVTAMLMQSDTFIGRRTLETVDRPYVDLVVQAGGVPVVLPTVPADHADDLLDGVDALILSGGGDVHPSRYSTAASGALIDVRPARDDLELALVDCALERRVPLLAVCRGLQVLNVALGGDLVPDVPPNRVLGRWAERVHPVQVAPGSRLAGVSGTTELAVNSVHHQTAGTVAAGLEAVAWAPDGVIEALEAPAHPEVLAVQWHPEKLREGPGALDLEWLMTSARDAAAARPEEGAA